MKKKISYEIQPWYYDDELPQAQKKLEENGFAGLWEPVVATRSQLQIDYDRKTKDLRMPPNFKGMLKFLAQRFSMNFPPRVTATKSKGGGTHIVIGLPVEIEDIERVAWQAAFGSDGKREALNILRVKRGIKNPILLYMPKDCGVQELQTVRRIKDGTE